MPIYEYICIQCGAKFDCRRPYDKADEPIDCSTCKSHKTRRALSKVFVRNAKGSITKSPSSCSGCSSGSCSSCRN